MGLLAILLAFFWPIAAWITLAVPEAYLLAVYRLLKRKRLRAEVPELSPEANRLLGKFPHFYSNPPVNRTIGGAGGALALAGVGVALAGCVQEFWWGLFFGLVNLAVMVRIPRAFEPTVFLRGEGERQAHNEILTHFVRKGYL